MVKRNFIAKFCLCYIAISISTLALWFSANAQETWSPGHVYYGKGGKLTYTPDELGNIIPDFSHVGYRYGDEPIPDIPVVVEVEPVEGDDGATIQAAINSLSGKSPDNHGFRGAILLKKGTYQVAGQILINVSGVVLRGEGNSSDGTVIIAEGTDQRSLIKVDNGTMRTIHESSRVSIIEPYVPVGRKFVVVSDATGYDAGDRIVLYRPGTTRWISDLKMDQIPPHSSGTPIYQWKPSDYSFYFERLVTKVSNDTLFFRNPVVMAMESNYGGGSVYKYHFNRLENIGIENLCLKSSYAFGTDEEHSWRGILFQQAKNGWVRNVNFWHFAFGGVDLGRDSKLITVENCNLFEPKSLITGSRRYSFYLSGSLNLFRNLTSDSARHDYASDGAVTGPNVFSNALATHTHADIGPHHRWAMGTLYEMIISDGTINVQDRGNSGSGHGWAGANTVFWNCRALSSICQSPYVSAKNYNFGFIGGRNLGMTGRPDGVWVGHNRPGIFPASLYEAQLDERLNQTTRFSAFPFLTRWDNSSFLMQFSLPLIPDQLKNSNFTISGTVPVAPHEFSITPYEANSVIISSPKFVNLPEVVTIIITAKNLTSEEGVPLNGISSGTYIVPDQRPVVNGTSMYGNNISGEVEASSSKPGSIYFVRYGLNITSRAELDSLVLIHQGRKVETEEAYLAVTISTIGLTGGYYQYYAVDLEGRISNPSSAFSYIEQKGPVAATEWPVIQEQMEVYIQNGVMIIDPGEENLLSIAVYSIRGEILYRDKNLRGVREIDLHASPGIFIVRKQTPNKIETKKIVIK